MGVGCRPDEQIGYKERMMTDLPEVDIQDDSQRLEWDEVRGFAQQLFTIWVGDGELRWAEAAWKALSVAGLANYVTEVDRTLCLVRVVALNAVYREFCSCAFHEGESGEWLYAVTADLLGDYPLIDAFSLGQLAEQRGIFADNGPYVEPDQRLEALRELAFDESRGVARALEEQWGENELFFSLYVSNRDDSAEDDSSNDELYAEVLNSGVDYGAGKGQAYSWVADGMHLYMRRIG
jgi:hypothetical protein